MVPFGGWSQNVQHLALGHSVPRPLLGGWLPSSVGTRGLFYFIFLVISLVLLFVCRTGPWFEVSLNFVSIESFIVSLKFHITCFVFIQRANRVYRRGVLD